MRLQSGIICGVWDMGNQVIDTAYGPIAAHFRKAKLSDLCYERIGIQTGPFGSQLHQKDYVAIGTPIITVEHLGENRIIHQDLPRVSEEDRKRLGRYALEVGDIVFSRVGAVDRRSLVREEEDGWLFSGRCLRVRPNAALIDSVFLSWFFGLPSFKDYIRRIAVGATMPSLNTEILSNVPIYYPPLPEQRAIAHILGTLDDKIELNRKMNETLEAMVQALFKNWFVDFGPVGAKAEGRDPGLPKEIVDLFPDRFEDSELGEVPVGWVTKTIGGVAERVAMGPFGSSIKVETFVPEGVPIISGQHLHGLMLEDSIFNFVTHEHAKRLQNANVQRGDVVFTHAGNIGQAAFIPETSRYDRYVISQRQFYMRCDRSQVTPEFIALYFNSPEGQHQLLANTSSSGVPSIARPVTYLRSIKLTIPKRTVLDAFEQLESPLLLQFSQNKDTSCTLAAIRDTLLPKLLSGEIRVKDAERFVESRL